MKKTYQMRTYFNSSWTREEKGREIEGEEGDVLFWLKVLDQLITFGIKFL